MSSIGTEDVRNTRHCCHLVSLANRETVVWSSALPQSLWRNCSGWVSRLLWKCYCGTLMPHVTVTWRRRRFKSDKFSNWHALLQVSRRSVFMALHEVEHTYWQTGTWHACAFLSSNQLQRKLRPTADSKYFIGCVNHSVNLISYYTMLQKRLTPKPTPHLTLTLTSEIGTEKKVAVQEISS